MKKLLKKVLALSLCACMMVGMATAASAAENKNMHVLDIPSSFNLQTEIFNAENGITDVEITDNAGDIGGKILIERENIEIDDGLGNKLNIEVETYMDEYQYMYFEKQNRSTNPEYPIGQEKTFVFKISNGQLGAASFVGGVPMTNAMKNKLIDVIEKTLLVKVGSKFLPYVNVASWVIGGIATINDQVGNNGFNITTSCKYFEHYLHKEGYYLYGWDILSFTLGVY